MAEGTWYAGDIDRVIVTEDQIRAKTEELAKGVNAGEGWFRYLQASKNPAP